MKPTLLLLALLPFAAAQAELKLPAIIGDHMVLQQKQADPIWGWDTPGTAISVAFAGQTKSAKADASGKWTVKLDAMPANAKPQTMTIKGSSTRELTDILVGEVWICSGQSNMQWNVGSCWDGDLEIATAKYPQIHLISVPQVGTQEPQQDFKGAWAQCSPQNVGGFSAVGFFYGRLLHEMLGVPVGLINNAWGGSAAEAWVRRDVLEQDKRFKPLMERTVQTEANLTSPAAKADYDQALAAWKVQAEAAQKAKQPAPRAPQGPQGYLNGNARPGNIFNGVLLPTIGYGIKGAIWYQGETNAGRAYEYADLFPLMITHWRELWGQGDFPFYWVQLADFMAEQPQPGDSSWAELRESQTKTITAVKNGGQAVIIDLGEASDIHPKNKRDVAERLARWALVKDYGMTMIYRSPEYKSVAITGNKAVVSIDTFGSAKLRTLDVNDLKGFAICGEDKKWVWADAKFVGADAIEVSAKTVAKPIAVRYAWADNPVCNVISAEGLPLTPFRTDSFDMITKPKP